jgi:Ca2+/Na+ antiporter
MDTIWDGVEKFGHMGWCLTPFAISGIYVIYKKLKEEKDKSLFVLVVIFVVVALCSGIITFNVDANRINIFMYAYMILIVAGIYQLFLSNTKMCVWVGVMSLGMFVLFYHTYFTSYMEEFKKPDTTSYNLRCALNSIDPDEYDVIYLTPDSQATGSRDVTEIDTIYVYDLDIPYIQGKSNINHGIETVPYKQKYQYTRASELQDIDRNKNCVYIINVDEEYLFDDDQFEKKNFGPFMVVY